MSEAIFEAVRDYVFECDEDEVREKIKAAGEAERSASIGVGMVIAAAIIVRVWGDEVQAEEILGAAGLTSVQALREIGADAYDVMPLRGVIRSLQQRLRSSELTLPAGAEPRGETMAD